MKPAPTPIPVPAPAPALDFRRACEDCAYFLPERGECAHEYPTATHRKNAIVPEFCKEFELA